jgi:hypothetical protein
VHKEDDSDENGSDSTTSIIIEDARVHRKLVPMDIFQAGCFNADEDCQPLATLATNMKKKFTSLNIRTSYQIPKLLLEKEDKNMCIGC